MKKAKKLPPPRTRFTLHAIFDLPRHRDERTRVIPDRECQWSIWDNRKNRPIKMKRAETYSREAAEIRMAELERMSQTWRS